MRESLQSAVCDASSTRRGKAGLRKQRPHSTVASPPSVRPRDVLRHRVGAGQISARGCSAAPEAAPEVAAPEVAAPELAGGGARGGSARGSGARGDSRDRRWRHYHIARRRYHAAIHCHLNATKALPTEPYAKPCTGRWSVPSWRNGTGGTGGTGGTLSADVDLRTRASTRE